MIQSSGIADRFRLWSSGIVTAVCLAISGLTAHAAEIQKPKAVVELFTSQGCNSCPPADRVLSELAKKGDVLALAWHVDYWDYLGWKDTFGDPEHTKRQRAYAVSLGKRSVYTPQAIINGRTDVVGSKGVAVQQQIDAAAASGELSVPIKVSFEEGTLAVEIDASEKSRNSTLWIIYFNNGSDVPIKQGENGGQTLHYSNIVRDSEMIGMVKNEKLQTRFPLAEMGRRGYDSCALVLQKTSAEGTPGPIVGAAIIKNLKH